MYIILGIISCFIAIITGIAFIGAWCNGEKGFAVVSFVFAVNFAVLTIFCCAKAQEEKVREKIVKENLNQGGKIMKANELMIGDWMSDKYGYLMQITFIGNGYAGFEDDEGNPCQLDDKCNQPEPIPLTLEILEKNGFLPSFEMGYKTLCLVSSEYAVYYRPFDTYLYVFKRDNEHGEGDFIVSDYRNTNAKYVHELQHAFRICGLNELADNFKL